MAPKGNHDEIAPLPPPSNESNCSNSEDEDEQGGATLIVGPASNALVTPTIPSFSHNHNIPKTPVSALPTAFEQLSLTSTPVKSGTASGAQTMKSNSLIEEKKQIHLHYAEDLRRTHVVKTDTMIKLLLCSVLEDDGESITTQRVDAAYNALYDEALGLSNAESSPQNGRAAEIMKLIRLQMKSFVAAKNEQGCYVPFVAIGNLVMDLCRDVKVDDVQLAQTGDEEFLFQVNDPCRMRDEYRRGMDDALISKNTYRKPDILGTMFAAVRAATGKDVKTRDEYVNDGLDKKRPENNLSWVDARIAAEFKYTEAKGPRRVVPKGDWSSKPAPTLRGKIQELLTVRSGATPFDPPSFSSSMAPVDTSSPAGSGAGKRKFEEAAHADAPGSKRTKLGAESTGGDKAASKPDKDEGGSVNNGGGPTNGDEPDDDDDDRKPKNRMLNGAVQLAIYASARLSSSSMICHSINLLVNGRTMWIWYFDRGRIVCSEGIDIFDDFPFFVLLLSVFQRMDRHAFGQHAAFRREKHLDKVERHTRSETAAAEASYTVKQLRGQGVWSFKAKEPGGKEQRFSFDPSSIPQLLELAGRGTAVFDVDLVPTPNTPQKFCGVPYTDLEMVVKIYHPEEARTSEVDILKRAYAAAKKEDPEDFIPSDWKPLNGKHHIQGHLPVLLGCADHEDPFSPYLDALDIEPKGTKRRLRLLVFLKLKKITDLSGPEYIKAWLDCLLCHAALWRSNVHHRDISVSNLMYYRLDGKVHGVLNDYDLSILPDEMRTLGTERTGTWPFMAVEMLLNLDKKSPHIYDYDAESFLWCLLWTTHRYVDGKVPEHLERVFDGWTLHTPEYAARNKGHFINGGVFHLTSSHMSSQYLIADVCGAWVDRENDHKKLIRAAAKTKAEVPPRPSLLPVLLAAIKTQDPADYTPTAVLPDEPSAQHTSKLLGVNSAVWTRLRGENSFDRHPA